MQGVTHTHLFAHTPISQAHTHRQTCSTSIHTFMYMYTFIYMHTHENIHEYSHTMSQSHVYNDTHVHTYIQYIHIHTCPNTHMQNMSRLTFAHTLTVQKYIHIHTHILAQLSSWQHYHSTKNKLQHRALLIETTPSPALCCTWAQPSQCPLFIWDPAGNFQGFPMTPSSNSLLADGIC